MIRIFFYKLFSVIFLISVLTSCNKIETDRDFEAAIKSEVQRSIGGTLEFKKIAAFKWTKVLILAPYTNIGRVQKEMNVNLKPIEHSDIDNRDDINQLIFFDDDKIIKMIEYPRSDGDFEQGLNAGFYSKDNAIFRIMAKSQKWANRKPWIVLKQAK